jgi:hypothetical protein
VRGSSNPRANHNIFFRRANHRCIVDRRRRRF